VLFQLAAHQAQGERSAIHRDIQLFENVGQGADVILVPVRQHDGMDLLGVLLEV
jgi:hypothetical protein